MRRIVKHFSLHRIAGTELRVVADVEEGVLALVQVEEAVIRSYMARELWPHTSVTLFILQDLQPLIRQLRPGASLPPGGPPALDYRPVLNVYDLASPAECHVFVNQQAMAKEGYWGDALAIQGLLAHEHAHPLAENETTRASRQMALDVSVAPGAAVAGGQEPARRLWTADRQAKVQRLLAVLADKLCCYGPREVFANELTITSGFGDALLHLNRLNMANAVRGVAGREELRRQLQQEVSGGSLTPAGAEALLLIGDLRGYLDLALETAPFYRAGQEGDARGLEIILEEEIFPHLEPAVAGTYAALRDRYISLRADLSPAEMVAWGDEVLSILTQPLSERGLKLSYHLRRQV